MKLLTKAIIGKLEKTRYDKEKPIPNDAPVLARFFNPTGSGTWSVLEGEKLPNNDWRFFGVVDIGQDKEYGYFNLSQLQDFKGQFGLGIERDRGFKGTRASLDKEYGFKNPVNLKKSPLAKNDKPEDGKTYQLTGSPDDASIERGDSWKQSEVKDSNLGKQLPLMVDGKDPKETNSSTLAGIPVNNKKTPTSIEKLLKRITSWRKSNNLGDNKIDFKDYALNKAFVDIKADTEIMIKQLRKEKEKKQEAKELITLLQNTLYGKGKNQPKPTPDKKQTKEKDNTVVAAYNSVNQLPNFKTKSKGKYPHRVAWLQSNGSWVVVDLNDRTLSTSLNIDNLLKKGDTPASEIKKSLSWNQIDEPRARPYLTFRIIKESTSAPKDINFMSFGKIDIKVNKNGFSTYEKRDPNNHYDRKGESKTMKYTRSNFKYPRANNRYSMWNSREKGSKGKLGFKILKRK